MKSKRKCFLTKCDKPARSKGLCRAHYQAHHVRGVPLDQIALQLEGSAKVTQAVRVQVRISGAESEKLDRAISDGRVKETRYAFVQQSVRNAINDL